MASPLTYKGAGVDTEAGARFADSIRPLAERTRRAEVIGGLGGFSGLFAVPAGYGEPVLVAATDGVGSKLEVAFATGRHETVGLDLVAMVVDDVVTCGAEPLFFLDYLAIGRLDQDVARALLEGIAGGCARAGCALIGGETSEIPGFLGSARENRAENATLRYDLAGFCVGVVERSAIRDGRDIAPGDAIVGLLSSGLHANGHSLARRVLLDRFGLHDRPEALAGATVADELLRPTRLYAPALAQLRTDGVHWKAAAHITGGGLVENPPRMFSDPALTACLELDAWPVPPVFSLLSEAGVSQAEMRRTFNMGVGMLLVFAPEEVERALEALVRYDAAAPPDERVWARRIGRVEEHPTGPRVRFG